ncbi:MAG TPA: hypothetical protein VFL83_18420 [Anaeromyxobacter sp.]|nr:hypothetical protein [Anaeromyxobacter sp.]
MRNLGGFFTLLACAAGVPATAAAAPELDQQQRSVLSLHEKPGFAVGGSTHQKLAQVVTAGRSGTLVAVAAPVACFGASSLTVEIRGVHVDAAHGDRVVPDATVRASGTTPGELLPYFADPAAPDFRMLALSQPVALAAGEQLGFVLSADGQCVLAQAPRGDLYAGGEASFIDDIHAPYYEWLWFLGDADLPFETWTDDPALEVAIDVKPGSDENPVNLGARGRIPVAILGSEAFDVEAVDLATVRFAGAPPATTGRGEPQASLEDVNADGILDLVLHFAIQDLGIAASDERAALAGATKAPGAVELTGSDRIRVVPAPKRR